MGDFEFEFDLLIGRFSYSPPRLARRSSTAFGRVDTSDVAPRRLQFSHYLEQLDYDTQSESGYDSDETTDSDESVALFDANDIDEGDETDVEEWNDPTATPVAGRSISVTPPQ